MAASDKARAFGNMARRTDLLHASPLHRSLAVVRAKSAIGVSPHATAITHCDGRGLCIVR